MNPDLIPFPGDELETLVRASLDRRAEQVDPRPGLERLQSALNTAGAGNPQNASKPRRMRAWLRWAGPLSAAAAVLLLMLLLWPANTAHASDQALLREAQQTHQLPVDRCYLIEVHQDADLLAEDAPVPPPTRTTRLWTRGDRFYVEARQSLVRVVWGREASGALWMIFGTSRAIRIEPEEMPRWLGLWCELHTMKPETLLADVLRDFELQRDTPAGDASPHVHVLRAKLKPGHFHPMIRNVLLEIDRESKVLRRVVLVRQWNNQRSTATYTLVDSQIQDDAQYRLEGHLAKNHEVFTRDQQPQRRLELLRLFFGARAKFWFKDGPAGK